MKVSVAARITAVCVFLAMGLASCGGTRVDALPIVSGMQPVQDGWAFANFPSSAYPDIQFDDADVQSMFGNDSSVCVDGKADPCELTAEAATWARMVNQSRASGQCMGLAMLAAQRFNDNITPVTSSLSADGPTLRAINRAFATQFLPESQAESEKWLQSPLPDIIKTVEDSLTKGRLDYTLGLFGPNGGHAVTPFAVEYPSADITRVMVYDSNWPGRNRYVDFDLAAAKWTFSYSSDSPDSDPEPWVGGAGDMDLTSVRFDALTCPFCETNVNVKNSTFVIRTDNPNFSIETDDGIVSPKNTDQPGGSSVRRVKGEVAAKTYDYVVSLARGKGARRAKFKISGTSSVFAVLPSGIAQIQTPGSSDSGIIVTDNSISTTDPFVALTVAAGDLVASVSGSSSSLTIDSNSLSVAVTLPSGEIVQKLVDENQPSLLSEVDPETGSTVILQSTTSGVVERVDIAKDGTQTESRSTEPLNLKSVVPTLPPALESVENPSLPSTAERNLNNPKYQTDTAYEPTVLVQKSQGETPSTTESRSTATTSDNGRATTATVLTSTTTTIVTSTTTSTLPVTTTTAPRPSTTLPRPRVPATTTTLPPATTTSTTTTTTTIAPSTTTTSTTPPNATTTTSTTTTTIAPTFTVSYNGNGNTSGSVPPSSSRNSSFTVAANSGSLARAGYTFSGWNTSSDGSGTNFTAGTGTLSMSADTTLFAEWTANSLAVTYDSQGGSAISNGSTTTGGQIASSPGNPTRSGYTFNGWFVAPSGGSAISFSYTHGQTSNFTLYAQWIANSLTVTYDSQGGSAISNGTTTTGGQIATSPGSPTRSGYTFNGWFAASSGGSAISFAYTHGQTSNFTLYAQWTASLSCTSGGSCAVGDTGPGGGIVFYVQSSGGSFACGEALEATCKYLEVAPSASQIYRRWSSVANQHTNVPNALGTAIGTGNKNTAAIVAQAGNTASNSAGVYSSEYTFGGKSDWYLPSKDELNELCKYAKNTGQAAGPSTACSGGSSASLRGFTADWTWSSTQGTESSAGALDQNFADGSQGGDGKDWNGVVRPIRAFG